METFSTLPTLCEGNSAVYIYIYIYIYASVDRVSIDSDNGLAPNRDQAIFYTNAGILLTGPLGTNFSKFLNLTWRHFDDE